MKIINKDNFLVTVCATFTVIAFVIIFSEAFISKSLSATHLNLIMAFVFTFISVFVLSQHYRFERFSPLVIIIIQYVLAILMVMLFTWGAGFLHELDPNAYHDVIVSFTIPYVVGAIVYYVSLYLEIKKQNKDLQLLKKLKERNSENEWN